MSAHDAVAAIVGRFKASIAHVARGRPPRAVAAGAVYQPGALVIDPATGKEWQVVHGSRETVLAPAPDR